MPTLSLLGVSNTKVNQPTMKKVLLVFFAISLSFSCNETIGIREEAVSEELNQFIQGSWLYVEYGYSPGDKYYTVPVPADPQNTITFKGDLTMSSANMGLDEYKYYRILEDTVHGGQVIAFFEEDPGNKPLYLAGLTPTYYIFWKGNYLIFNYRWCIEGCHMKFKRMPLPEQE